MAVFSLLCRGVAGLAGVGICYVLVERKRESRYLHAMSYGRHCYDDEKRMKWDSNWDCREPVAKETKETKGKELGEDKSDVSTATRHLYLIRHGQYVSDNDPDRKVNG